MRQLPSGTLTMLFSDIEGSTLTLNRLGDRWGDALSAQRSILRTVFALYDGYEMGTEGDSFFVVFSSARQAVRAALEGQRRLQAHDWPDGVPIRVRMGVHTGEPTRHEDGYIGLDVHRAARVAGTASGGQVVLSEATRLLVGDVDDGVTIRDLGWHRLKDLSEAEHLYDLAADGLMATFPPLRSIGTRANLPTTSSRLVGRDGELAELGAAIQEPHVRLLTLTGPGGSGKTRLAVSIASAVERQFPAGVFFVDLHTARRAATMWLGIAEALDASGQAEDLPRERVRRFLADRAALLILDNLEQISDADEVVSDLLSQAATTKVLATSRRPLHLVSEHEHPVPPLTLPDSTAESPAQAVRSGAVELFVIRARMVRPAFELNDSNLADVIDLCRRLDGLPLAIELAAARSKLLSPRALLGRLDQILGTGAQTADRTTRQRTLAATIAWSYDLLTASEQEVFCRLGVFAGSCDIQAIETVVNTADTDPLDTVAHLVDMSLVQVVDGSDGEPRVTMLETIRTFARQQLDSRDGEQVRLRHAQWCLDRARAVDELLLGPSQLQALDRMSVAEDEVRGALQWCLEPSQDREPTRLGLQLVTAMTMYWYRFGYAAEGRLWCGRALAVVDGVDSLDVVQALHGMAIMQLQQGDVRPAIEGLERAVEMTRRLDDRTYESRELNSLAIAYRTAGDLDKARQLGSRSVQIAREIGDTRRESAALSNLLVFLVDARDWPAAVVAGREAMAASARLDDTWAIVTDEFNMTMALLHTDGAEAAYTHLWDLTPRALGLEDTELSIAVVEMLAAVLAGLDEVVLAAQLIATADTQRAIATLPRSEPDQTILNEVLGMSQAVMSPLWQPAYEDGAGLSISDAIARGLSARVRTGRTT